MRLTQATVLAIWREAPERRPTFDEIRTALGARANQQRRLQQVLDQLVKQDKLKHKGARYWLHESAVFAPADRGPRTLPVHVARSAHPGLVGVFSAHPNGFGFIELTGEREALFVPPRDIGGALDGDTVRVQRKGSTGRRRTAGRVEEVLQRRRTHIRGHLRLDYGQCWVAPLNPKLPMVFIAEGDTSLPWAEDTVVEAELTAYPEHHDEAPEGRIVQAFEDDAERPEQIVLHILADLAVSGSFSPATQAEMARLADPEPASGKRTDLRKLPFVTIDGEDARDFDDAVCLAAEPDGNLRLWVSIADVAAYVRPGSAVDADAYHKGTSVYFPNQVFPMLPERLSNDLCSLRPHEERLTLTCEMLLTPQGERRDHRIYESVIRSQARLTYTQVQAFFDSDKAQALPTGTPRQVPPMLRRMRALAAAMRERRERRGALNFVFPEARFELDRDGFPRRIVETWPTEATRLIEQFMLEANETVAWHTAKHDLPALYRVHDPPPPDAMQSLLVNLVNFGVELKRGEAERPDALKRLLHRIEAHPQREQVEVAILRTLSQAQYRPRNDGHFALAATHYTHFTSPIRRYPDLLLHRSLKASFAKKRRPFHLAEDAGMHLSLCERTAGEAESRVGRLYKVLYLEPRLGETFPVTVNGISDRGLWLRLRDDPVDGNLPMEALPFRQARYDRERGQLVTRGSQPNVTLGDRVTVQLVRADRLAQELEFAFVAWGWPAEAADTAPTAKAAKAAGNPPRSGGGRAGAARRA